MNPLVTALRRQREFAVEVAPGVSILLRRPAAAEMPELREMTNAQIAVRFAVGWKGVTEALLLGPAVGAEDDVPFDGEVWAEVVADRVDWIKACADGVIEAVTKHLAAEADAAKN